MPSEIEFDKMGLGVDGLDLLSAAIVEQRDQHGHQTSDDMRIAVAVNGGAKTSQLAAQKSTS